MYVREVNGKRLSFIVSGMLWRNSLVMNDRETASDWSHITGEALNGPMKGERLEPIPAVQTTWAAWYREHPTTKLLQKEEEVRSSHYESYFTNPDRTGLFRTQWLTERLPGKAKVHGLTIPPFALAVLDKALKVETPVFARLGDTGVLVVRGDDGGVRAYITSADDRDLNFEVDRESGWYRDAETGSTWDLTAGKCTSGELAGRTLEPLPVGVHFWFAWSSFYPNTDVIDLESR